jgi:hypothetical protein
MASIKSWRTWWHGLSAAVISSIANAGIAFAGSKVIGIDLGWKQFFLFCGSSGIVGAFAYLKQSPLPKEDEIETPNPTVGN